MKLNIPRLRYNENYDFYYWNLRGRECKLQKDRTTFKPRYQNLGYNLDDAIHQAQELNKEFENFKNGIVITNKRFTFGWCLEIVKTTAWWEKLSDNARRDYDYTFKWLKELKSENLNNNFLDIDHTKFDVDQVHNLKKVLLKGRDGKKTGCETSAKIVLGHLRTVMKQIATNQVRFTGAINPFLNIDVEYSNKSKDVFATQKDLAIVVKKADELNKPEVGDALTYCYWTTLRVTYAHTIMFNKHIKDKELIIEQEKNNSLVHFHLYDHDGLCLYPELVKRLEEAKKKGKGMFLLMRQQKRNSHGFIRGRYYPYTKRYFQEQVFNVLKKCKGLSKGITFKSFRKGGISDLATDNNEHNVMAVTGHRSSATLKHYINYCDPRKQVEASKNRRRK